MTAPAVWEPLPRDHRDDGCGGALVVMAAAVLLGVVGWRSAR